MIECIIPAAGYSKRMGEWKIMLPWEQSSIIDAVISTAEVCADRIILVTGYRAEELENRVKNRDKVKTIRNHFYPEGMFSSIQTGVRALSSNTSDFFILHADLPCIKPCHIQDILIQYYRCKDQGYDILQPFYLDTPGHPVIFNKSVIPAILKLEAAASMKKVFSMHKVCAFHYHNEAIIQDTDTKENYQQLVKKLH